MTTGVEINNYFKNNKLARIMVVDDEKDILRIIKRDLENHERIPSRSFF